MKKKKSRRERRLLEKKTASERKRGRSAKKGGEPLDGMLFNRINRFVPQRTEARLFSGTLTCDDALFGSELVFTRAAAKQIKEFTDWGKQTERNRVEQQGMLLGQVYSTPDGFIGLVEFVVLSEAVGNSVYIESAHSEWSEMDRVMDEENARRKYKLVKVGWWHTHPNMSIFMSETDKTTQRNYFNENWQFAAVLNPQHMKWGAFVGEKSEECFGCFINLDLKKIKKGGTQ